MAEAETVSMEALFGSEGSESSEDASESPKKPEITAEIFQEEEDPFKEDEFDVDISKPRTVAPVDLSIYDLPEAKKGNELFFVKLSNILGLESSPFDPVTFKRDEGIKVFQEQEKHEPDAVMRWRYSEDNTPETNARFVEWEDGTTQLLIGTEVIDVDAVANSSHQHVFIKHAELLKRQENGELNKKFIFRPNSLKSKSHKNLVASVVASHKKTSRVRLRTAEQDPEIAKQQLENSIEDAIKENEKRKIRSQQKESELRRKNPSMSRGELVDFFEADDRHYSNYDDEEEDDDDDGFIVDDISDRKRSREDKKEKHRKKRKKSYSDSD